MKKTIEQPFVKIVHFEHVDIVTESEKEKQINEFNTGDSEIVIQSDGSIWQ